MRNCALYTAGVGIGESTSDRLLLGEYIEYERKHKSLLSIERY